ncbi:MAG: SGNH/GDSL hydrolase family protein, partial [bacterium]
MSPTSHVVGRLRELYGVVLGRMRCLNEAATQPCCGRVGAGRHAFVEPLEQRLLLAGVPDFSQMIVFGDSLSDTGNCYDRNWGAMAVQPLLTGNVTVTRDGRFTGGAPALVWHEYLASLPLLGELQSATQSSYGGQNYAFGGARATGTTHTISGVAVIDDLGKQVVDYTGTVDSQALYVVWAGGNDLIDATKGEYHNGSIADAAQDAIASLTDIVEGLAASGAQYILWPNLPPLHLTPWGKSHSASTRQALETAESQFNVGWEEAIRHIASQYGVTIYALDDYALLSDMIADKTQYGLTNVADGYVYTWGHYSEAEADSYLFWDDVHPTRKAHELLGQAAYSLVSDTTAPGNWASNLSTNATYPTLAPTTAAISATDTGSGVDAGGYRFAIQVKNGASWSTYGSVGPTGDSIPLASLPAGQYRITAEVWDSAGNHSVSPYYYCQIPTALGPGLTNPTVTPQSGAAADKYVFTVHYYSPDGIPPLSGQVQVFLSGGESHWMHLITGTTANGTYSTNPLTLASREYSHFFYTTDCLGSTVATNWLSGPTVAGQRGSDVSNDTWTWDDSGDGDGVMEAGETAGLKVRLLSSTGISNVNATLASSDPDVTIINPDLYYSPLAAWTWQWPVGSHQVVTNFTDHRMVDFVLHVTYEKNGQAYYQDLTRSKTFYRQGELSASFTSTDFTLSDSTSIRPYNNGDGVIQSGEVVEVKPRIANTGRATATDVSVELAYTGSDVDISADYIESYPNLSPGASDYPATGSFQIRAAAGFTGLVEIPMVVTWMEGSTTHTANIGPLRLQVDPAGWLVIDKRAYDFGVTPPGTDVSYVMTVRNAGTAVMNVTSLVPSQPDTTFSENAFTVAPGESHLVTCTVHTTGLSGQISRTIQVNTDARVQQYGKYDTLTVTGLVSASVPFNTIPGVVSPQSVDVDGDWIAWSDSRNGNCDVFLYRISTGEVRQVTTNTANQTDVRISGTLVVWSDDRNWDGVSDKTYSGRDIYGYDIATGQEFVVAHSTYNSNLCGVDNGRIAFTTGYEVLYRIYNGVSSVDELASNFRVLQYQGNGALTQTYSTTWTPGSGTATRLSGSSYGDFGNGMLVFQQDELWWQQTRYGSQWSTYARMMKIDFGNGETSPSQATATSFSDYAASTHRFVFAQSPVSRTEIWIWENGATRRLTGPSGNELDYADQVLAFDGRYAIYDKYGQPGLLFYYDTTSGNEYLLTNAQSGADSARANQGAIVWRTRDANSVDQLAFAFLDRADIAVSDGSITTEAGQLGNGTTTSIGVTVRNLAPWGTSDDVIVQAYDGNPLNGGVSWGSPVTIVGGMS